MAMGIWMEGWNVIWVGELLGRGDVDLDGDLLGDFD
jgi:hypothetical protein